MDHARGLREVVDAEEEAHASGHLLADRHARGGAFIGVSSRCSGCSATGASALSSESVPTKTTIPIAVVLGILAAPRAAHAESFALSWTAPEPAPCVEPRALESAVVARLGRDPFVAPGDADVILGGRMLPPAAGRRRAQVEQRARDGRVLGSRALEAATCEELTRSVAFVMVLIVDPDALTREREPEPVPVPTAESPKPPAPRARTSVEPRREAPPVTPARPRSIVNAGAALGFTRGLLPGGDAGGFVTLGVTPWALPLGLEWRGGYRVSLASPRNRGFAALAQEWRGCWHLRPRARLGGAACAGVEWAAIFPEAGGLSAGDRAPKNVVGPLLALGPSLRLGDYAIGADVSVFFPQPRYLFSFVDDAGRRQRLHELDRVVVSATIGVTRAFY